MIEIVDLFKSFNGKPVLKGVNLTVRDGETLVIIGRSGCGKSVLLKHIIGLLQPDRGQVIVDGFEVSRPGADLKSVRLRLGMVFQGAALFDSMSVGENVAFPLREHTAMTEKEIVHRVRECLEMVGLGGTEDLKPAELSGGMKKRVGLARALALRPQIILYDEPTTGVDPVMADTINRLINQMRDKLKVTSVVVTHDMVSAYHVADRIAMLHEGQIAQVGTVAEIRLTHHPVVRQFIEGKSE